MNRLLLHRTFSVYQTSIKSADIDHDIELHEAVTSAERDSLLNRTVVFGAVRANACAFSEMTGKTEGYSTGQNKHMNKSERTIADQEKNLTDKEQDESISACRLPMVPFAVHEPQGSKFATTSEPNGLNTKSQSVTTLQPSPFAQSAFGEKMKAAFREVHSISTTAHALRSSSSLRKPISKNLKSKSDISDMTREKKMNAMITSDIVGQFRLHADNKRIIPMHLTRVNQNLSRTTIEHLGNRGGLLKFLRDRPQFFRLMKIENNGGWYVTIGFDIFKRFKTATVTSA